MSERDYLISKANRVVTAGKFVNTAKPASWRANPKYKHLLGDSAITHVDDRTGIMTRNGLRYNVGSGARIGA